MNNKIKRNHINMKLIVIKDKLLLEFWESYLIFNNKKNNEKKKEDTLYNFLLHQYLYEATGLYVDDILHRTMIDIYFEWVEDLQYKNINYHNYVNFLINSKKIDEKWEIYCNKYKKVNITKVDDFGEIYIDECFIDEKGNEINF